jgi:site-specific recombinase XerD
MEPDLAALLPSWQLALGAEHKSPRTISSYADGVRAFLRWAEAAGFAPELTAPNVQAFIVGLLNNGAQSATARARHIALRLYADWLVAEGELAANPLTALKLPKLDSKIVDALTDEQLRALVRACAGKAFVDRRDEAAVRLMAEAGLRASEVIGLTLSDVEAHRGIVTVRRGKGGKGRLASFGPQTAAALDRYTRARRSHRLAESTPAFWLGGGGQGFSYHGLALALKRRATSAGINGFHLHQLRHTMATRWKAAGGSDDGLMAQAGWSSREMIDRYAGAAAAHRSAAEARRLNLGDV